MENKEFQKFSKCFTSIRAFAIISIIIYHQSILTILNVNQSTQLLFAHFSLANIGVDIFVILSGMLLTIAFVNTENHSWKNWYKRRAIRIFPILIITSIFMVCYDFILQDSERDLHSIIMLMSGLYKLPTFDYKSIPIPDAFWFISFILSCYLIFPFIIYAIRKNYKLTAYIVIFLFFLFGIFGYQIFDFTNSILNNIFNKELEEIKFDNLIPRYFEFVFGMLLGFWTGKNEMSNLCRLKDKRITLLSLISLIILYFLCLFLFFYQDNPQQIIPKAQIKLTLYFICFPLISFSFIFLMINVLYNQHRANDTLDFPGKASYEIFLTHFFAINFITMIMFDILLISIDLLSVLIYIVLIIIASIILGIPFHFLAQKINTEKKIHPFFLMLSIVLVIYSIIYHLFYRIIKYTDITSVILFGLISISLILIVIKFKKRENKHIQYKSF